MKTLMLLASMSGALGVCLGAFGAHALREKLDPAMMNGWEKAVLYEFIHTLAMLAALILYQRQANRMYLIAGWLWFSGILLFSGSLYLLSTRSLTGMESLSFLGPVTPVGGLAFIAGWVCLAIGAIKKT